MATSSSSKRAKKVRRVTSSSKACKVLDRLEKAIQEGSFYEAHQTYRALYQRFCAQGNEEQALSLLLKGAATLLKHGQYESGTDLGLLFITYLKEKQHPITPKTLDKISHLFELYKSPTFHQNASVVPLSEIDPREIFMRAALKWSSLVGGDYSKHGHPYLHKMLAMSYWEGQQYGLAREHFLYACQPENYSLMLVEVSTKHGYPGEADLFLAQAVLQLLVMQDKRTAHIVYTTYIQTHPILKGRRGPPFKNDALLNFVWFLLLSIERIKMMLALFVDVAFKLARVTRIRGDGDTFKFLRWKYRNVLSRDPCFADYLDKIGSTSFGMSSVADSSTSAAAGDVGGAGGLGGLLGMLGGAGGGRENEGGDFLGNLVSSLTGMLSGPGGAEDSLLQNALQSVDTLD